MKHYEAHWSMSLIVMPVLTTVVCLGVITGAWLNVAGKHPPDALGCVKDLALAKP